MKYSGLALEGIVGKHAEVLRSMCRQHAGSGCFHQVGNVQWELGEKTPPSQTCF